MSSNTETKLMTRFAAVVALFGLVGAAGGQAPAVATLKAKTRIVPIDVVVTDKEGRPVKSLQASDFALAENGAAQTVSHFEAHTSLSAEDAAKLPEMPKLDANIFTNYSPAPASGPLTVLIFDALNTKMSDQSVVLKQMLKYLDTPHPGVRMELFELNDGLKLVQGFTSDPAVLRAALMSRKAVPQASAQMNNPMSDDATAIGSATINSPSGLLRADVVNSIKNASTRADINMNRTSMAGNQLWTRQLATLEAMDNLARYLGGLRGRKNLLWFSGSFSIPTNWIDVTEKLHETMAALGKSQVAVYPIVAYGLMPDLDTMHSPMVLLGKVDKDKITMERMAEDTGGKVFANSNDLAGAVEQAVDDGSNYYTLTYTPTNRDWKGDFRKVEVKLAQAGYTLSYRPGYYAEDSPAGKAGSGKAGTAADPATAVEGGPNPAKEALAGAMEFGSPQPVDVVFKVAVNPATGHAEKVVARANSLAPNVAGPYERYVISVAALPTAFTFTKNAPGKIHVGARLVTRVYTADGALINSTSVNIDRDVDDARYEAIMANGMKFQQEISVPVKGESFLRIGVEDLATSRVGVVEIPVATVAKLKPLGDVTKP